MNNSGSLQQVAPSTKALRDSYDTLYRGWLGSNRNTGQARQILDKLHVHSGVLLDVACGLGYLLDMAEDRGVRALGLDISRVALRTAKKENPSRRVLLGDGEHIPLPSESFDFVVCLGSLEHFIDPEQGLHEMHRVLKPEGRLAILLPNSHHLLAIYNVIVTGGILSELQDFERFATPLEWQHLLERNGFKVMSVHKYNVGFSRFFRRGRGVFWYLYNILFRLAGDFWIPRNLSFSLTYICEKGPVS